MDSEMLQGPFGNQCASTACTTGGIILITLEAEERGFKQFDGMMASLAGASRRGAES